MSLDFLSLQGASHLALNVNGQATILRELGNQTSVEMAIKSETYSKNETKTGKRQKVFEATKAREVNLSIKMDEQKQEDIALAFQAELVKTSGRTVTGEPIITLQEGDTVKLGGFNLSNVAVKDSTGKLLVAGTDYEVNLPYGKLTLRNLANVTQPLSVDYTEGDITSTVLFSLPDDAEYYYFFEGINSINNKRLSVELWRFKPTVDSKMDFINAETGEIEIKGSALADIKKQQDPQLGGFGRIVYID